MKKLILFSLLLIGGFYVSAQRGSGFGYGIGGGLLLNSATLPDIKVNTDIEKLLSGENLVKGKANYSDLTFNYRVGGFIKYDHGFGFALVELNYTTTKIYKEFALPLNNPFNKNSINLITLDRSFAYFDIALSYNIYLSDKFYFSVGATPAFLLSNTGNEEPNSFDLRVLTGFGYNITDKLSISTKLELGVTEVYDNTYIHQIMIPVTLQVAF
jgi:hypothetical protein